MKKELDILLSNVAACRQRIDKLTYSLSKNRALFPLAIETINSLTDDQEESIDALILRYSQSVSMIQDQIFRGIAYAEQEDLSDKSNRDKMLLMEKLGAIRSADEFGTAAILRNKFSHHYLEDAGQRLERLNLVVQEAEFVIEVFRDIVAFLGRKGFTRPGKGMGNEGWEMSDQRPHYNLEAWKESMALVKAVYIVSQAFPKEELNGLTSQMRRAAVSAPSNLAEGAARTGQKEFAQFLSIARGSLSELETQLLIAVELGYLAQANDIFQLLDKVSRLITGLHKKVASQL